MTRFWTILMIWFGLGVLNAGATMTPDGWRLKGLETLIELCRSGNNNTILLPSDVVKDLSRVLEKL